MRHNVLEAIEKHRMLFPGDGVMAALSGGADSVALLHCLAGLAGEMGFFLSACHVNHGIRGEEALRDQRFCEKLCRELGIPLTVEQTDVPAFAAERKLGLEEAARDLRYDCLFQAAREWQKRLSPGTCVKLATAHTLSDNLETILFSLARGTGLAGLCGIPPVRRTEGKPDIIRPLLEVSRTEIEEYCRQKRLDFVVDSTNSDESYTRNKLRHRVIPLLREINPNLEQAAARMAGSLQEDRECLEGLAKDFIREHGLDNDGPVLGGFSREPWLDLPQGLAVRTIQGLLAQRGIPYDSKRLALCCQAARKGQGAVEVEKGFFLKASPSQIRLEMQWTPLPYFEHTVHWDIPVAAAGKIYAFRLLDCEQTEKFKKNCRNRLKNCLDYDKIYGIVKVRQKRDGDSYVPWGRSGSHSLKKLFQEAGVAPFWRSRSAVLEDQEGILWAESIGCSGRAAPGPDTTRLVTIHIEDSRKET